MKKGKLVHKAILINLHDNVAIVLNSISRGDMVNIIYDNKIIKNIIVKDDISRYHKIAINFIKKNENILKYGEIIGRAQIAINEGAHVHVHNIKGVAISNEH